MGLNKKHNPVRREKTVPTKRLWSRLWFRGGLLCALGFLVYMLFAGPSGLTHLHQMEQQNQKARDHLDSLHVHKQDLEIERERLRHDSSYLEAMARRELGMAKPGEKVYRFMEGKPKQVEP